FSKGNMKPVSNMVGNIIPIIENSMAVCCELVTLDMSKPSERQVTMNKVLSAKSKGRLPLISTSRRNTESNKMMMKSTKESTKYGIALATSTKMGLKGDTNNISIVPISFSRTTETDVSAVLTIIN